MHISCVKKNSVIEYSGNTETQYKKRKRSFLSFVNLEILKCDGSNS